MGQPIEVHVTRLGDVTIFATDRTLGGQDGESFDSAAEANEGTTWPARLAARLWDADSELDGVYVLSNTISIQRSGGWDDDLVERAAGIIRELFVFYEENRAQPA